MNSDWSLLDPIQYFDGGPQIRVEHFAYNDDEIQMMQTLMDEARGIYLVRTSSSSVYLISLDLNVVSRFPGTGTPTEVAVLRRDHEQLDLLAVFECTVGTPMVLAIDLHLPFVPFTLRRSMDVVSIERLSDEDETALL
jgi:hypothetical protein